MAEQPPEPGALAVMGFERPDVAVCLTCARQSNAGALPVVAS